MQIIVLDKHPVNDGRIKRHIEFLMQNGYTINRIHFNRSDNTLQSGFFSQFGERGYRINFGLDLRTKGINPIYSNFFCFTPLILHKTKKAIQSLSIDTSLPTILHVHDPALLNLAFMLKRFIFSDSKLVYDRHEVYETKSHLSIKYSIPKIARLYESVAKNKIDGIISVSEEHNTSIGAFFPKSLIHTVPNYPSTFEYNHETIRKKLMNFNNESNINLIYVGSLANKHDRDVDLLLSIGEKMLSDFPNAHFYIGGACTDLELKKRFTYIEKKFVGRFEYLGVISRERVAQLTEISHIGFLLIRPETHYWVKTSPNKTYEYLICGTVPVIRADIDHAQELAKCSLLFSRETPEEEIIDSVRNLLDNPDRLKRMMENALVASNKFRSDSACKKYIEMYDSLFEIHAE